MLAALSLFWGLNFPAMRVVLVEMPPWHFRILCLYVGGGALLTIAAARGLPVAVPRESWFALAASAVVYMTGWHMLTAFGLMMIDAGRAGIIAFTMPLWAAIFAGPVLGERIDGRRWLAVASGIVGLLVLVLPAMDRIGASPLGSFLILCAAWCWCGGTLIVKSRRWTIPAVTMAGWQLLIGGVPIVAGALVFEWDVSMVSALSDLSVRTWTTMAFVLAIPMVFCQFAWFRLVELLPANVAALSTLTVPVVGLIASWLLLDEYLSSTDLAAMALIIAALALVLIVPARSAATPAN